MMPYTDYTVRLGDLKRAIVKNPYNPNHNIDGYMRYLKYNTPSAEPERKTGKWIPCSERLPEHTDFYLIQHTRKYCADEMAVAFYSVEEHEIDPDDCWEFSSVGDVQEVIAWMPLPEPYGEVKP